MALIITPAQAVLFCYDKPMENPSDDGGGSATPQHPSHPTRGFALTRFVTGVEVLLLPHNFVDIYSSF